MQNQELKNQLKLQKANFKVELEKQNSEKSARARDPKLPYFDESKDKLESCLSRFEKYAMANNCDKNV